MDTILIVDDEKNYLVVLETLLESEGYEIITASNGSKAVERLRDSDINLIITDVKMPAMSGMELLKKAKELTPDIPVIMMTAFGTIEMAVEAMKEQAFDYITKPFENDRLKMTVKKALESASLKMENRRLKAELSGRFSRGEIVGKSPNMLKIFDLIDKMSNSKASVLVTGPSGTGKELVAKSIHFNSPRKDGPFISVNCGALTETLLESELFGHERGAFTGAVNTKKGRFELAHEGAIFLDEIGEMSQSLQVKLLRVLQEREFERVGGTKTIQVDVRVIAATNRDIKKEVESGTFREDLFYRLNVIHMELPPLKERMDDIPMLVRHFLAKYNNTGKPLELHQEAWKALYGYNWPGNVRELENVIERAVILQNSGIITAADLPEDVSGHSEYINIDRFFPNDAPLQKALEIMEEKLLRRALGQHNGIQSHAAKQLGITKSLMQHKMKKYKISAK